MRRPRRADRISRPIVEVVRRAHGARGRRRAPDDLGASLVPDVSDGTEPVESSRVNARRGPGPRVPFARRASCLPPSPPAAMRRLATSPFSHPEEQLVLLGAGAPIDLDTGPAPPRLLPILQRTLGQTQRVGDRALGEEGGESGRRFPAQQVHQRGPVSGEECGVALLSAGVATSQICNETKRRRTEYTFGPWPSGSGQITIRDPDIPAGRHAHDGPWRNHPQGTRAMTRLPWGYAIIPVTGMPPLVRDGVEVHRR